MNELIYFGSYLVCGKLSAYDFELLTYIAHTHRIKSLSTNSIFSSSTFKDLCIPTLWEFGVGGVLRGHLGSARKECALTFRYGDDAFSLILGVVLTSLGNLT